MTITTENIGQALADERHLGFGYACTRDISSASKKAQLDNAVAGVANELGLDAETFFHWTNSKLGRWLADGVLGRGEPPTKETVRKYLNPEAVAEALDFEGTAEAKVKKQLVVTYDVTGLSEAEIDALTGEAVVQAERSKSPFGDGHPDVPVTSEIVTSEVP